MLVKHVIAYILPMAQSSSGNPQPLGVLSSTSKKNLGIEPWDGSEIVSSE